jgi:hypothetical protein
VSIFTTKYRVTYWDGSYWAEAKGPGTLWFWIRFFNSDEHPIRFDSTEEATAAINRAKERGKKRKVVDEYV